MTKRTKADRTPVGIIAPTELVTPKLTKNINYVLWTALSAASNGSKLWVSCLYQKQTKAPARKAPGNYMQLPGVPMQAQIGPIINVFRRLKDDKIRFTLWSITRQEPTCIIPEGLLAFATMPMPETFKYYPEPVAPAQGAIV